MPRPAPRSRGRTHRAATSDPSQTQVPPEGGRAHPPPALNRLRSCITVGRRRPIPKARVAGDSGPGVCRLPRSHGSGHDLTPRRPGGRLRRQRAAGPDRRRSACEPGKEYLVRAIAESAYRHGARFVDVAWFDPWVKRARIEHAREETLDFVPPWYGERMLALGEHARRADRALRAVRPRPARGPRPRRAPAATGCRRSRSAGKVVNERTTNWTIVPCPTPAWATARLPRPRARPRRSSGSSAPARCTCCGSTSRRPDRRLARARRHARSASPSASPSARFDALHYEGPGTDLTVGLLPGGRWQAARFETVDGIEHMPNLPTEEVFTTPDPQRADGHVTSTKPLVLHRRHRRARTCACASRAAAPSRSTPTRRRTSCARSLERDEGAARLGEVALVDDEGRIGTLDTVFYDTLLDENAASHIALGQGFPFLVGRGRPRARQRERRSTSTS